MSTAKYRVAGATLAKLLRLPDQTIVQSVDVTLSHPDIPAGTERVDPLFRSHHKGPRAFLGWNPCRDADRG